VEVNSVKRFIKQPIFLLVCSAVILVAAVVLIMTAMAGKGLFSPSKARLVYTPFTSLYDELGETGAVARRVEGRFGEPGLQRFGGTSYFMKSVMQRAPGSIRWRLRLPEEKSRLEFTVGYVCPKGSIPGRVDVRVTADVENDRDVLFEYGFWVRHAERTFANLRKVLPLDRFRGREITLTFESLTDKDAPEGTYIVWGYPAVFTERRTELPNIVLICMDTLRADRVDYYNPASKLTPSLRKLAEDGVVFRHAISQSPWTLPSVASVLTGLNPSEHRAGRRIKLEKKQTYDELDAEKKKQGIIISKSRYLLSKLPGDVKTIPELIAGKYFCHMVNGNFVLGSGTDIQTRFHSYVEGSANGRALSRRVDGWLSENSDKLFFFYAHFMEPHELTGHYREKFPEGTEMDVPKARWMYDQLVRMGDSHIGQLLERLKELNLYDSSLIIFYSDHGEHLWDEGFDIRGHGATLSNILLEVPLIVKFPYSEHAGSVIEDYVKLADIFPTILSEAGAGGAGAASSRGISLRRVVEGKSGGRDRLIVSEYMLYGDERIALQDGEFRLVYNYNTEKSHLFDSATDKPILRSSSRKAQSVSSRLQASLKSYLKLIKHLEKDVQEADFTDEEIEKLKQIGYIR